MQTPTPQAIDSLDGALRVGAVVGGDLRDGREHAHRAAGVDDVGVGALEHAGQDVGDAAALADRAVLGGDGQRRGDALGLEDAEELRLWSRRRARRRPGSPRAQGVGEGNIGAEP